MKKVITFLLALVATNTLWAYDFKAGDLYYNIISNTAPYKVRVTYELLSVPEHPLDNYLGLTDVVIPDSVTYSGITYSVTSIEDWAFCDCSSLTSIKLPYCITNIGLGAFSGCTSLHTINIPDGITSIKYDAFSGCSSLTSINIPSNVTSIGEGAFGGCSLLTSIAIPNNVTNIGDYAFNGCTSLTSINIPDSVTSIGKYVFYRCTSLPSITLPDGVISIGDMAFCDCFSLTSITIPNGVTSIGAWAFYDCSSLTSVTCKANTPPTLSTYAFHKVPTDIPVYVPCESLTDYQADAKWNSFTNIQCMPNDESAVDNITSPTTNSEKLLRDGQVLIIRNGKIYNAQGIKL